MTEDLTELAKRRGFYFGSNEAYGGVGGFYTYGPQGAALKRNVEAAWRDQFTVKLGNVEITAPNVMPEPVFEASGHLDTFDDMLVKSDSGRYYRADHLIEEELGLEEAETLSTDEIESLIAEHDIRAPDTGEELAGRPVVDFNLMFETAIGPGDGQPGYLRPETAQGIFVEFPRLKEYARNQLPFGVTQIGRAYRNEISPRGGLRRLRELNQAELEQFVDPERDEPPLADVADVAVRLYPAAEQTDDDGSYVETTVGEAVEAGTIASDWVGYFLGIAQRWYEAIGVDTERFRFRQHLAGERAHYASDCWDAESEVGGLDRGVDLSDPTDGDWMEIAGFAYRGDYDLSKHAAHADDDFTVFQQYDEPKEVERTTVDPDMSVLGPEFGAAAADVAAALRELGDRDPAAFDAEDVTVEVDGTEYVVPTDVANFERSTETVQGEHVTPHVVEPSFGVDRTVLTLLVHGYREDEVDGEARTYMSLAPSMAPADAAVFPLVSDPDLEATAEALVEALREAGLSTTYDDSGNIGRRYRRQDEVGTPFCVTVDHEGLESDGPDTVTVRERDTTDQVRVPVEDLPDVLTALERGTRSFGAVRDAYDAVETDTQVSGRGD
jgi:glycyl-tRNA synthetase